MTIKYPFRVIHTKFPDGSESFAIKFVKFGLFDKYSAEDIAIPTQTTLPRLIEEYKSIVQAFKYPILSSTDIGLFLTNYAENKQSLLEKYRKETEKLSHKLDTQSWQHANGNILINLLEDILQLHYIYADTFADLDDESRQEYIDMLRQSDSKVAETIIDLFLTRDSAPKE